MMGTCVIMRQKHAWLFSTSIRIPREFWNIKCLNVDSFIFWKIFRKLGLGLPDTSLDKWKNRQNYMHFINQTLQFLYIHTIRVFPYKLFYVLTNVNNGYVVCVLLVVCRRSTVRRQLRRSSICRRLQVAVAGSKLRSQRRTVVQLRTLSWFPADIDMFY